MNFQTQMLESIFCAFISLNSLKVIMNRAGVYNNSDDSDSDSQSYESFIGELKGWHHQQQQLDQNQLQDEEHTSQQSQVEDDQSTERTRLSSVVYYERLHEEYDDDDLNQELLSDRNSIEKTAAPASTAVASGQEDEVAATVNETEDKVKSSKTLNIKSDEEDNIDDNQRHSKCFQGCLKCLVCLEKDREVCSFHVYMLYHVKSALSNSFIMIIKTKKETVQFVEHRLKIIFVYF